MSGWFGGPVGVGVDDWRVLTSRDRPGMLEQYRQHAVLAEHFADLASDEDGYLFVGVERPGEDWPSLVINQTFGPAIGFSPGS